jgi:hypothetical protein
VAHVCAILLDELLGQLVQLVEVVAAVCDLPWLKAKPLDDVQDARKVLFFLLLGVCVIVAQVADALVVLGEAKVDCNGFAVADVKVAIGLWRETRAYVLDRLLLVDALQPALGEDAGRLGIGRGLCLLLGPQGMLSLLGLGSGLLCGLLESALGGALLLVGGWWCGGFGHAARC